VVTPPVAPESSLDPRAAAAASDERPSSWYEALDVSAFVDGYYSFNFNGGKPQVNRNQLRAYDRHNGFSLAWAALDVSYSSDYVGATVNFRVGPGAAVYSGVDDTAHGLEFVKQAYATWRPWGNEGRFTLDFGKWESMYGAETSNSQANVNYTRGALYTLAQPFFFTGLKATYAFTPAFSGILFAANGWNESVDNNAGKSFGLQLAYTVPREGSSNDLFNAKLGYVLGPEQLDYFASCPTGTAFDTGSSRCLGPGTDLPPMVLVNRGRANTDGLRHFIDLIVTLNPSDALSLVLNGDFAHETELTQSVLGSTKSGANWYGVSLMGRYRFSDVWALGLRGEFVGDPQGVICGAPCALRGIKKLSLATSTLTVEADPDDHLILKLDGRIDAAGQDVFTVTREGKSIQATATLGVVATTD
jgi:hypothetical protein